MMYFMPPDRCVVLLQTTGVYRQIFGFRKTETVFVLSGNLKLLFLSNNLEKVVYVQLQHHLELHGVHEKFQSSFKSHHRTEL